MKLQEAIASGKPFKREDWSNWFDSIESMRGYSNISTNDVMSEDWIIKIVPLSKEELIEQLKANTGGEEGHSEADALLLDYINDKDISEAYNNISNMWYA